MAIIDFVGIPGAGKSTLVTLYIKDSKESGIIFKNLNKVHRSLFIHGVSKAARLVRAIFYPSSWKVIISLIHFLKQFPFYKTSALKCLSIIDNFNRIVTAKGNQYFIYDNGLLLYISSVSHLNPLYETDRLKAVLTALKPALLKTIYVYCKVDAETASFRAGIRQHDGHRFDSLYEDERLVALEVRRSNLDTIINTIKKLGIEVCLITIDSSVSVEGAYSELRRELDKTVQFQ